MQSPKPKSIQPNSHRGVSSLRSSLLAVAILGLALSACSQDTRRARIPEEASTYASQIGGADQPARRQFSWQDVRRVQAMSFCYSAGINRIQDVTGEAREACKGGRLALYSQDNSFINCPLLQPVRITFICYPPDLSEGATLP